MVEEKAIVCVGCRNEIPKATDRRNIFTKQAKEVASFWEGFLGILRVRVNWHWKTMVFSRGINVKDRGNQRNMCRKCYYLYDKTVKSYQVIN